MAMQAHLKGILIYIFLLGLTACGGGGGNSSNNSTPQQNTSPSTRELLAEMIKNPQDYSEDELKQASIALVDDLYSKFEAVGEAKLGLTSAQEAYNAIFSTILPNYLEEPLRDLKDLKGNVNLLSECTSSGTRSYTGQLNEDGSGSIYVNFNKCSEYNFQDLDGELAISIYPYDIDNHHTKYFSNNLSWQDEKGKTIELSGYYELQNGFDEGHFFTKKHNYSLLTINDGELFLNTAIEVLNQPNTDLSTLTSTGDIFVSGLGTFSLKAEGSARSYLSDVTVFENGTVNFNGENSVFVDFNDTQPRYYEDNNGDGQYDRGTFITDEYELMHGSIANKNLVSIDEMSRPPSAARPFLQYTNNYTTNPITVFPGQYSDPDNRKNELVVSYQWYLNDQVIPHQNEDTLPAFIAKFGDKLSVSVLISDGINTVESPKLTIDILDSPPTLSDQNRPNEVSTNQLVQFTVATIDPDNINDIGVAATLVSAPEGATIDEQGLVTWLTPESQLLPEQTYYFTFNASNEISNNEQDEVQSETLVLEIKVTTNTHFPLTKTGIKTLKANNSIATADFNGDGQQELLLTDGLRTVFILENNGDTYQQTWSYPFKLTETGQINQVLSSNIDNDDASEIIVVTSNGITLIDGLTNLASVIVNEEEVITHAATMVDINHDGVEEIAYLKGNTLNDQSVFIIDLNNNFDVLFSAYVGDTNSIAFGNVDDDANIELITNNGYIYDTSTAENQWLREEGFGESFIITGDFNGDGIDEVAGANWQSGFTIYSIANKEAIASIDSNPNSYCALNLDSDAAVELIIHEGYSLKAYELMDNTITENWELQGVGPRPHFLTTGDSDNDGIDELHWVTNVTNHDNRIYVVDLAIDGANMKYSSQLGLDNFIASGWASMDGNEEQAIFLVPETYSYESNVIASRVVGLTDTREINISPSFTDISRDSKIAVANDFNNDGFGDLFVPSKAESFSAVQLNNSSTHWEIPESYNSEVKVGVIKSAFINNDEYMDAIYSVTEKTNSYSKNNKLKVVDVMSQTILIERDYNNGIHDFVIMEVNGKNTIFVATEDKIHTISLNGTSISDETFFNKKCSLLEVFNYDEDDTSELVCVEKWEPGIGAVTTYTIYDVVQGALNEIKTVNTEKTIVDIEPDPSSNKNQSLFLILSDHTNYNDRDVFNRFKLQKRASDGSPIWDSPDLVGQIYPHNLKTRYHENKIEIQIATTDMMYWIK
ncbi:hypothetical protein HR060_02840 [Catenovulum sp. SM1970]|uniref:hypothetical protein n=1 Tax=Marinifaba aquimaris TaxID=2741323 RepID=UPI0015742305|nr:hypothetical protein [Marinifaba aquimaris]NTS75792.1 hypothetical protein [Marinifaba aquimaris]